ncbi:MAG: hypothetical protein F6K39_09000 [Okeania sp. SIO3B3]|nr:hypothetical protein [Okeania sp. SIO3B3]
MESIINCDLRRARLDCCYLKNARFLYTDMRGATIQHNLFSLKRR